MSDDRPGLEAVDANDRIPRIEEALALVLRKITADDSAREESRRLREEVGRLRAELARTGEELARIRETAEDSRRTESGRAGDAIRERDALKLKVEILSKDSEHWKKILLGARERIRQEESDRISKAYEARFEELRTLHPLRDHLRYTDAEIERARRELSQARGESREQLADLKARLERQREMLAGILAEAEARLADSARDLRRESA